MTILQNVKRLFVEANHTEVTPCVNNERFIHFAKSKKGRSLTAHLVQHTNLLTNKDIATWRNAWQMAINVDNPNRGALYDIYEDCLMDLHLMGCIQQRKEKNLQKNFHILGQGGKRDENATAIFKREWFNTFCDLALDSRFWGHSLIQFGDVISDNKGMYFSNVELVPRKHVVPEFGVVTPDPSADWHTGISYRNDSHALWCIEVGEPKDLGLLLKCAPSCISKKNMLAFWDKFGEIFGAPMSVVKVSTSDVNDRKRIESSLGKMGTSFWALFPEGANIEIKENNHSDAYNVFDKRVEKCNSEISKVILMQTITIDKTSSTLSTETQKEVFNNVVNTDAKMLANIINGSLIPLMEKHGFPVKGKRFVWDRITELSPAEQMEVEKMLLQYYEIDPKYFEAKYNIPVVEEQHPHMDSTYAGKEGNNEQLKIWYEKFHETLSTMYNEQTMSIELANKEDLKPNKSVLFKVYRYIHDKRDFNASMMKEEPIKNLLDELYRIFSKEVKNFNEDVSPRLRYALANNIHIFSGFKTANELREIGLLLVDDKGSIKPFDEFFKDVKKIDAKYNENYLYAEYNLSVANSQMAVKWSEWEKDGDKFNLQYRTAKDDKVRDEHEALEGITLPPSDPFWDKYLPPNGWNCRCTTVQVDRERYPNTNSAIAMELGDRATKKHKQHMFRFNPGKKLVVFPPNHPYYRMPDDYKEAIENLNISWLKKLLGKWKNENIPPGKEICIEGNNFVSGSLIINRNSIEGIKHHRTNSDVLLSVFDIENEARYYKYIGWKNVEKEKHHEADYFTYYSTVINGKTYYINVETMSGTKREVVYCITKNCDLEKLRKGTPTKEESTIN